MTYARSRLWLGIFGIGTLVLLSAFFLVTRAHEALLPSSSDWQPSDVWSLAAFVGAFWIVMIPFDLLGGFIIPSRFGRHAGSFDNFFNSWLAGTVVQSMLFFATGLAMLAAGRALGIGGVVVLVAVLCVGYVALQGMLMRLTVKGIVKDEDETVQTLIRQLESWGFRTKPILVVDHLDPGFTGGIVGLRGKETVVVPFAWLQSLSPTQLAAAVARRIVAIRTGSRTRGLLLALVWILTGFTLAAWLPGAGVESVVQLTSTYLGFTLWTFLGLLILPSISRRASYAIDAEILSKGVPAQSLEEALVILDRLQDDEPERPGLVEAIFHPVPSVANRRKVPHALQPGAWHVARMVLFLSWSCLGLLSRAVHCNAGRPELWVMLPTD